MRSRGDEGCCGCHFLVPSRSHARPSVRTRRARRSSALTTCCCGRAGQRARTSRATEHGDAVGRQHGSDWRVQSQMLDSDTINTPAIRMPKTMPATAAARGVVSAVRVRATGLSAAMARAQRTLLRMWAQWYLATSGFERRTTAEHGVACGLRPHADLCRSDVVGSWGC